MPDQAEPMVDDERRAEREDAERHLADLHALRAALLPDADDSLVLSELSTVEGQIRATEARLREQDASAVCRDAEAPA
jgi:hypothetical protein